MSITPWVPWAVPPLMAVDPVPPQPWPLRTVGALAPAARPGAGKKWATILVPSNDVTTTSRASADGASASMHATDAARATAPLRVLPMRAIVPV